MGIRVKARYEEEVEIEARPAEEIAKEIKVKNSMPSFKVGQ